MTASAQGIDVSAYQPVLTAEALAPYSFAFAKATNGNTLADGNFGGNWRAMKDAGKIRGAYHELVSPAAASGQAQAAYFLSVVVAEGLEPGDMLAVVASDYGGVTDFEVKSWCDAVKAAAPLSPVLVYSDLTVAKALTSCTGYDLWVAHPSDSAPESVTPWKTWRLWQWGSPENVDHDAHNGTEQDMRAWLGSVADPVPPDGWTFGPPQRLAAHPGHTSVRLEWSGPGGAPEKPAQYRVFIYEGTACSVATLVTSYPRETANEKFRGGGLKRGRTYTAHVVAEGPDGTRVAPDVYASAVLTTG
jgi:lysozyme